MKIDLKIFIAGLIPKKKCKICCKTYKKMSKNLHMSKKSSTFATSKEKEIYNSLIINSISHLCI